VSVAGATWNWKNCYTEATAGRALSSTSYAADDVSLESWGGGGGGGGELG
jgi:hypothetical protein